MKINFLFLIFAITGCSKSLSINSELLRKRTEGVREGIIISCTRCNCVISALKQNQTQIKDIALFGSKTCLSPKDSLNFNDLQQSTLDSIYEKNYNLIFFKESKSHTYNFKLIKTEDVGSFIEILNSFFDK